jgi:hypothetical protein
LSRSMAATVEKIRTKSPKLLLMKTGREEILNYLKAGEFERAMNWAKRWGVTFSEPDIYSVIDHFSSQLAQAISINNTVISRQLRRRIERLTAFGNSGFDSNSLLPLVELPDGYSGKILLVSVFGGIVHPKICLRSNDLYHRDILRNTEFEVQDLGLTRTRVHELGGASLHSEPDESLRIWGGSREFGACDKELAAKLVKITYPGRRVVVED